MLRPIKREQHMNVIRHDHMTFNSYGISFLQKQKLRFTNAADS